MNTAVVITFRVQRVIAGQRLKKVFSCFKLRTVEFYLQYQAFQCTASSKRERESKSVFPHCGLWGGWQLATLFPPMLHNKCVNSYLPWDVLCGLLRRVQFTNIQFLRFHWFILIGWKNLHLVVVVFMKLVGRWVLLRHTNLLHQERQDVTTA